VCRPQVGGLHPPNTVTQLLQARQNLFRVGTGIDLGKGLCDPALFVDQIRDAAGKTGVAGAVGFAQYRLCITQQRKLETVPIGKGFVGLNRIKTHAENLYIVLHERVIMVTEPVPFRRSSPRIGFGVKPEQHFLAPKVCQGHRGAVVGSGRKLRGLDTGFKHLRSPQHGTHAMPNERQP